MTASYFIQSLFFQFRQNVSVTGYAVFHCAKTAISFSSELTFTLCLSEERKTSCFQISPRF